MKISFDENTKKDLLDSLEKKGKTSVRLMIKSFGWGGPSLGVVLDEQRENDIVEELDGIKFVAEDEIGFIFEDVKLISKKGIFGTDFQVFDANKPLSTCNH